MTHRLLPPPPLLRPTVVDIRDGGPLNENADPGELDQNKLDALAALDLLRQQIQGDHVQCVLWVWLDAEQTCTGHRIAELRSTTNTTLRGLVVALQDYVRDHVRGVEGQ